MFFKYREVPGEIIYAYMADKYYISYSMVKLSNFYEKPSEFHYAAIERLISYISSEHDKGIVCFIKYPYE